VGGGWVGRREPRLVPAAKLSGVGGRGKGKGERGLVCPSGLLDALAKAASRRRGVSSRSTGESPA
jgi:hypothetical protein